MGASKHMVISKARLEAFSDGVIAIIITIMVLEIKIPHGSDFTDLKRIWPTFLSYVLSFIYVGIYWNNHHHMWHAAKGIRSGVTLWANLHLLFWLSLFPFATAWMGKNHFAALPTALYGFILLMAAIAYSLLQHSIIYNEGTNSTLQKAIGKDIKGKVSVALYLLAMVMAFVQLWIADFIYVFVALMWLLPDRRIEKTLDESKND